MVENECPAPDGGGNFFKNYYRYALACNGGEEVEYWKTLSYKPELYA